MTILYDKDSLQKIFTTLPHWQQEAFRSFKLKMTDKNKPFPCIPAQHGFTANHLRYGFIGDPRDMSTSADFAALLKEYTECSRETGQYASFIVFIHTPIDLERETTVEDFEHIY
ncbi:hypothetical protein KNN_02836 [Bacillus thuringiensis serovar tolworthi]|nr:hypothetical protein KNN_02836 [Bacillus thuringiensis serovar tolworthi]